MSFDELGDPDARLAESAAAVGVLGPARRRDRGPRGAARRSGFATHWTA